MKKSELPYILSSVFLATMLIFVFVAIALIIYSPWEEGEPSCYIRDGEIIRIDNGKDLLEGPNGEYYLIRDIKEDKQIVNNENKIKFKYGGKELEGEFIKETENSDVLVKFAGDYYIVKGDSVKKDLNKGKQVIEFEYKGKKVKAKPVKEIELTAVMWVKI